MSIEATYWFTRFWIGDQAPTSTSTEVSVVRPISATEMPSAPRLYWISKAGIQACRSTNCMPGSAKSKPVNSSTLAARVARSEEHTSELQSLMRISYAVFCLKQKKQQYT